jgi:hypothetical protein
MNDQLSSTAAAQELMDLGGVPVDRMAWRVIAPGEHYEQPAHLTQLCFDSCPPMVRRDRNHQHGIFQQTTRNLQGVRFGRLVVIGYWGRKQEATGNPRRLTDKRKRGGRSTEGSVGLKSQLWVCRCLCGLFTIRNGHSITRWRPGDSFVPRCNSCIVSELKKNAGVSEAIALEWVSGRSREVIEPQLRQRILEVLRG